MSTYYVAGIPYSSDELYHHGIKGQKHGRRRFQNMDGSLTPAGKARYLDSKGNRHALAANGDHAVQNMYNANVPKAKNVKEWFTGSHYKAQSEKFKGYADDLKQMHNQASGIAYGVFEDDPDKLRESLQNKKKNGVKPDAPSWERQAGHYWADSITATRSANKLEDMYQNAPRQKIQKAISSAKEAVGNAMDKASGAAKDVATWGSNSLNKGKKLLGSIFK